MSDLTISKLIKMVVGGFVIVVVILGLYFAMTSYVIPFFKGLGFGSEGPGGEFVGEADVCEEEKLVGSLEKDGELLYFKYEGEKTRFYILEDKIYKDRLGFDQDAGEVVDGKIIIFTSILTWYRELPSAKPGTDEFQQLQQLLTLEHSVIKGNEICES